MIYLSHYVYCVRRFNLLIDECFRNQPQEIELLFHMLRCFVSRVIPQFQFFRDFLDDIVAEVGVLSAVFSCHKNTKLNENTDFYHSTVFLIFIFRHILLTGNARHSSSLWTFFRIKTGLKIWKLRCWLTPL